MKVFSFNGHCPVVICVFCTYFQLQWIELKKKKKNLGAEIQNKLLADKQTLKKIESTVAFLEDSLAFVFLILKIFFCQFLCLCSLMPFNLNFIVHPH